VQGRAKKDSGRVTHEVLNTFEEWRAKFERRPLEETAGRSEGRCGRWETMEGESNQPFDGNKLRNTVTMSAITHHDAAEFE
jgi:hypothetical protein